jgi:hypothetical protein
MSDESRNILIINYLYKYKTLITCFEILRTLTLQRFETLWRVIKTKKRLKSGQAFKAFFFITN